MRKLILAAAVLLIGCRAKPVSVARPEPAYADGGQCRACHEEIAASYQRVAMARSLYKPTTGNIIEDYRQNNHFYHAASESHFRMIERDGHFYQQRYQVDEGGREINLLDVEVTYIIGSGNHSRSYVHRSQSGELTQLPVTWYSQERRWAMSPGYDRPKHAGFARQIDSACMFCHNAVPKLAAGADRYGARPRFPEQLPEGIDCQRCHGPGALHVALASSGRARSEEIRQAIVQPRRLKPEEQMDVCQQCHLEITSSRLPQALPRFGRAVYSFRPGQRLSDSLVHFDHPSGAGRDGKFEIVSAAYRLRKSACYQKSGGRLTCITCHNPHKTPAGAAAVEQFRAACRSCHSQVAPSHPDLATSDCAGCHMPKRRTEDVVHVAITDHLIQRRKPARDLLAALPENEPEYHGDLTLYDPPQLLEPDRSLYLGIALVKDGADRPQGFSLLEKGIGAAGAAAPVEAFIELAIAYGRGRHLEAAAENYRKALRIDPGLAMVRYDLARTLAELGNIAEAAEQYEQVIREDPDLAEAHNNLGTLLLQKGEFARAVEEYQRAIQARPIYPDAYTNLSRAYMEQGRPDEAQTAVEQALRCDPAFAPALNGYGIILGAQDRMPLAVRFFERAVRSAPDFAEAHYNLGRALHAQGKRRAAAAEYGHAIRLDPANAAAHLGLGVSLAEDGQREAAVREFREALRLRPGYADAERNLRLLQDRLGR